MWAEISGAESSRVRLRWGFQANPGIDGISSFGIGGVSSSGIGEFFQHGSGLRLFTAQKNSRVCKYNALGRKAEDYGKPMMLAPLIHASYQQPFGWNLPCVRDTVCFRIFILVNFRGHLTFAQNRRQSTLTEVTKIIFAAPLSAMEW